MDHPRFASHLPERDLREPSARATMDREHDGQRSSCTVEDRHIVPGGFGYLVDTCQKIGIQIVTKARGFRQAGMTRKRIRNRKGPGRSVTDRQLPTDIVLREEFVSVEDPAERPHGFCTEELERWILKHPASIP